MSINCHWCCCVSILKCWKKKVFIMSFNHFNLYSNSHSTKDNTIPCFVFRSEYALLFFSNALNLPANLIKDAKRPSNIYLAKVSVSISIESLPFHLNILCHFYFLSSFNFLSFCSLFIKSSIFQFHQTLPFHLLILGI